MLIGNYSVLYKNPTRHYGGVTGQGHDRAGWSQPGMTRGRYTASGWSAKSGLPDGFRPPYTWIIPQKPGALAARNTLVGSGALAAAGTRAKLLVSAMTGTGALTGTGTLVVPITCDMAGLGTLAILAGTPTGIGKLLADMAGTGVMTADLVDSPGWLVALIPGTGTLAADPVDSPGWLVADITPFAVLSPQSLAAAVWEADAALSDNAGTMGEKVNDAGSASNPWTEVIEGTFTAAELLRVIAAALAGQLSGAGGATITILGVDGATDRIVASVTPDGNRTNVTLDGA